MSELEFSITGSVGNGGRNAYIDIATVQALLNTARARLGQALITLDGKIGSETITAISDFQVKCFGFADGRVDVNGRSFKRLLEIYAEPVHINPRTYTHGKNGKYQVTVGSDGRIFVLPDDWLSKYSAAIYGNYYETFAFGRLENGKMEFIKNRNLIRSGEVIYHIDTWMRFMSSKNKLPVEKNEKTISEREKKQATDEAVNKDYRLKGDNGSKIADAIGEALDWSEEALEVASWILPILESMAPAVGLLAVPFETYKRIRDFVNAKDVGLRLYGLRAIAYATTAWAFNKPIPTKSEAILRNHRAHWGGGPLPRQEQINLDKAWKEAADAAIQIQEQYATEKLGANVSRDKKMLAWKATLRATGDDNPAKLSYELMKKLGEQFLTGEWKSSAQRAWESNLNVRYPD